MSIYRFICKLEGKPCDYTIYGGSREEIENKARAHAERFHSMNNAKSMDDLVIKSIEEVEDYSD
ncbi:DUF1059 domain-containing protein [Cuniculiplasma sp. SKW4]|uniref:DUF1059 domain-containing protein n=1 Tax=Cuniculiplasma sp. SKW4 TaxID=3400171 RepID=UPI003FD29858